MIPAIDVTILRHAVPFGSDRLSPLQARILSDPAPVRVFSAPTGAGKSYALFRAAAGGQRVLFVVPTRRLAQNLAEEADRVLAAVPGIGPRPVAIWSSDETQRRRGLDPAYRPAPARVREVTSFEDERFIVATPESVASMLLHAPSAGHGTDRFSIAHVTQYFDHIVFDEFHSIDARGFGLCAVVARACAEPGVTARTTFLSATPIDILPILGALGIPSGSIAVGAETVLDSPPGDASEELRVLHGDVRVQVVAEDDMVALLAAREAEARDCIARGRQVVLVFDWLEELHLAKDRLAALLDRLEVPVTRRLAINSIDDSADMAPLDGLFVTGRHAHPTDFDVLVATSSIEMGVTFRAGMLVMDAGHDALSFVQRLGRVARGDESGLVVVRLVAARLGRQGWLRPILDDLRGVSGITVSRFLAVVLQATRQRFVAGAEMQAEEPPSSFRSMPQRAVWAACLFWHVLESRPHLRRGQREPIKAMRPEQTKVIAALLHEVEAGGGFGARWAEAFRRQAGTLRDFSPTVTVVEPDGDRLTVPARLIQSRPGLLRLPMVVDANGGWVLHLGRPFDAALREAERVYVDETCTVLLPNGETRIVPRAEAARKAATIMDKLCLAPQTMMREEAQFRAAIRLVRLSGLIPEERDLPPVQTAIV